MSRFACSEVSSKWVSVKGVLPASLLEPRIFLKLKEALMPARRRVLPYNFIAPIAADFLIPRYVGLKKGGEKLVRKDRDAR